MKIFSERLKELRFSKGLSQKEVAAALKLTRSAYANYEQGAREPSYDTLRATCAFFGVTADYLIGLSEY